MAITKIQAFPSKLPHAHLYLDDVEEICGILIDACKKNPFPGVKTEEPSIIFSTRDSRMDSIEDLEKLGGSAKEFTIEVGNFSGISIRFTSFLNPALQIYSLSKDERWAVYSRIKAIFERRQYPIKNIVFALPEWIKWSLWVLLILSPSFLHPLIHHPILYWGSSLILVGLVFYLIFHPSHVSFVRSTERSKTREEWKGNLGRLLWLVLGVLIGSIVPKVVEHFFPALKK